MTLKAVVDNLEAVPEAVRDLYAEKDGKFHLAVEGLVPAAKLEEFRNNNRDLFKQVEDLTKKFDGIDPEKVRALQEQQRAIDEGKLITEGKAEEVFAARLAPVKRDYEVKLTAAQAEAATNKARLESLLIDGAIRDEAGKFGVKPGAIEHLLLSARATFKIVDGKAVPMDGDKVLFGKNGDPMTADEWMAGMAERSPFLFEPSQGGGSRSANPNLSGGGARVSRSDTKGFLANLDGIAKGAVKVS